MTKYINTKVNISEGQKEKLQHAIKANCSAVSIRLGYEDLKGSDILAITESQAKKLAKVIRVITQTTPTPKAVRVINGIDFLVTFGKIGESLRKSLRERVSLSCRAILTRC